MSVLEAAAIAMKEGVLKVADSRGILGEATQEDLKDEGTIFKESGTDVTENLGKSSIEEIERNDLEIVKKPGDAVLSKINEIKNLTPEQLSERMDENRLQYDYKNRDSNEKTKMGEGLTDEEKKKIKEGSGWSDEIVDVFRSMEEYEIYKKAELVETEISGKKCLIRKDIDWDTPFETGKYDDKGEPIYETNQERVNRGRSPLDENGCPIELHHIGQHVDSPLAELTFEEHRCNGNDTILHDKTIETEAHGEGNVWDREREDYWKNRAEYNERGGIDV